MPLQENGLVYAYVVNLDQIVRVRKENGRVLFNCLQSGHIDCNHRRVAMAYHQRGQNSDAQVIEEDSVHRYFRLLEGMCCSNIP